MSAFPCRRCTRLFEALVLQLLAVNGRVVRKVGLHRKTLSELASRDGGGQVAGVPAKETRRPFESLAITLIQKLFRWATPVRQSVASTV
jgi:hypothetical protein